MPYESNNGNWFQELPDKVKQALPTQAERDKFIGAFNSCAEGGGDDETCFRIAYSAARKADLPVGKALVQAKRKLPGWAWSALNTESFMIAKIGSSEKAPATLTDVFRVFSLSRVQKIRGEAPKVGASAVYAEAIVKNLCNHELIMKALGEAFDVLPGWAFATLQKVHTPHDREVVFICDTEIEGKALEIFKSVYLPLIGNPRYKIIRSESLPHGEGAPFLCIGLGNVSAAKDRCRVRLPHPSALFKFGDSGEVARKARIIKSFLDSASGFVLQSSQESPIQTDSPAGASDLERDIKPISVNISKTDNEKQIVTGVVLSPYTTDSQDDIIFPGTIEDAAHKWLSSSRTIGLNHAAKAAGAIPVESYLVPYPTREDYAKAMENKPHRAYKFKMGEDVVTSGSWILSTKLNDSLWKDFKEGNFEAYSIGGFGLRTPHESGKIPEIEYGEIGTDGQ